jgi:GTPase
MPEPSSYTNFRCGYAAIIGAPNVGKSTFLNAALGVKLSIVTHKPQTTRRKLMGFLTGENYQVVLIDTPGLITPKYLLQQSMLSSALSSIAEADLLLVFFDIVTMLEQDGAPHPRMIELLAKSQRPALAVLNKCDAVSEGEVSHIVDRVRDAGLFRAVLPISALRVAGIEALTAEIVRNMPVHPPLFPPDQLSDQTERFFVSEIVREKIFELFHQEVPYSTEVYIAEYKEKENIDYIAAEIIVERESQRRIIIGQGGSAIKRVGMQARKDIEEFLQRKVYLELHVRIRDRWRDDKNWIKRLGYSLDENDG